MTISTLYGRGVPTTGFGRGSRRRPPVSEGLGSRVKTVPGVRRLNEDLTGDVHQAYKGLFSAQNAASNWKRDAIKTAVIATIAIALVALAFLFHGTAGTILAGIGIAAIGFGLYSAYKTAVCYEKRHENSTVYEIAGGELLTKIFEDHEAEGRVLASRSHGPTAAASADEV